MTQIQYWNDKKNEYTMLAILSAIRGEAGKSIRYKETASACRLMTTKLSIEEAQKEVDIYGN